MTKRKLSTHRITWLILGGAVVAGAPSCGGRAGENSASGGEASTMGASRDEDGDGVVDSLGKTVDRDKDGKPDQIDVDGDGQDDGVAVDTDGDGKPDGAGLDTDDDGIIDAIDTDGDGKPDDVGSTSGDGDGDGDAGSGGDAGDGDSGSGGDATSTGDGDGNASGGTGGDDEPNPGVHTLGDSCRTPGDLGCAGENQKLQLLCDGSKWVANGTCSGADVCDTGEANRGSCQEPIEGCIDREPGERYCMGWGDIMECNADRTVSSLVESCSIGCVDGVCAPVDDPCPNDDLRNVDCTGECDEPSYDCRMNETTGCTFFGGGILYEPGTSMSFRLPHPTDICEVEGDPCQQRIYPVTLQDSRSFRVWIPEDWEAVVSDTFSYTTDEHRRDACEGERVTGCVVLYAAGGRSPSLLLMPRTEEAAARNLRVEMPISYQPEDTACPDEE